MIVVEFARLARAELLASLASLLGRVSDPLDSVVVVIFVVERLDIDRVAVSEILESVGIQSLAFHCRPREDSSTKKRRVLE